MNKYTPTIGLEIHAELKTQTKMFCACKNDPDEEKPNVNVCPICMGHPGTLPVINKEAVKHVLKVGLAVNGKIAEKTEFDRKNYFYPDIPKGYQISQYKHPLISGGEILGIKITRVHLEEDTGTSVHVEDPELGEGKRGYSLLNFNRAGVPLMELVTEPVIHSASEVSRFTKELQLLLQYLGVSDANMEKGEMRIEANVSVSPEGAQKLGIKVEIKNLNSFKIAEKAVEYEIKRQSKALDSGEKIVQETRGWNEAKAETFSQRQKEESHDYRYFPDPDLPKLDLSKVKELRRESLQSEVGETPEQKRKRFKKEYDIKDSDIEFYLVNRELSDFFEASTKHLKSSSEETFKLLSNYIVSDLASVSGGHKAVSAQNFAELIEMIQSNKISSRGAKDILVIMLEKKSEKNISPSQIAKENNLIQKSDEGEIEKIVSEIISSNEKIVLEYKSGKESALQFLIGQGMKLSKGSANPILLREILEKKIK